MEKGYEGDLKLTGAKATGRQRDKFSTLVQERKTRLRSLAQARKSSCESRGAESWLLRRLRVGVLLLLQVAKS